eukprot:9359704-Alexandrium_andersonii.AAC.1
MQPSEASMGLGRGRSPAIGGRRGHCVPDQGSLEPALLRDHAAGPDAAEEFETLPSPSSAP